MARSPWLLVLGLLSTLASGQDMLARKRSKLAEPWIQKNGWLTDYSEAKQEARVQDKHIMIYFTRSYAP